MELSYNSILDQLNEHVQVAESLRNSALVERIYATTALVKQTILQGNKILLFGNGGSASDAQHIAAEFTGRFLKERRGLPAIALTTDTSALTAIANDYSFSQVFARQVQALAKKQDLVIALSTSGRSPNIIAGLQAAREAMCNTIGFCGNGGGPMSQYCDILLNVDSRTTARIQEMHILMGHIVCHGVDIADLTNTETQNNKEQTYGGHS